MKKFLITAGALSLTLLHLTAYADNTTPPASVAAPTPGSAMMSTTPASGTPSMTGGPSMGVGDHPCKKIAEACQAAGFIKGGASSHKGLMEDCLKPIMEGQSVAGVTVNADDVKACQAKHAAHQR